MCRARFNSAGLVCPYPDLIKGFHIFVRVIADLLSEACIGLPPVAERLIIGFHIMTGLAEGVIGQHAVFDIIARGFQQGLQFRYIRIVRGKAVQP